MAYDTQAASVYGDLTIQQNLRYFARIIGAPSSDVERVIAQVGLRRQARQTVDSLSGGQESRVSLAVAMLGAPALLVLDEPTVGLDPLLRSELWGIFRSLAEAGATIVVSSHVMDEALRCDRIVLMRSGRIIADTTPARLLSDTGAPDPDAAFLALIERDAVGSAAADKSRLGIRALARPPENPPRGARGGGRVKGLRTAATAGRVLRQLSHDRRSIALMLIAPSLLVGLFAWLFSGQEGVFDIYGPPILALFPFIIMFLITSITTLRERRSGTLERLMTTPLGKADFILGYALAFGLMAMLQAVVTVSFAVWVCGLESEGPVWQLGLVAVTDAVLGMALGLLASAFARTEFQAVQFMPLIVFPQILLGGLFMPREDMPDALYAISKVLRSATRSTRSMP